ncbi:MAG: ATP-binding protein [Anaeromyxobacteraceae bacterium]
MSGDTAAADAPPPADALAAAPTLEERLEREIAARLRAEEALVEAERRRDEFIAVLSHELRNPLAPILNSVALLDRIGAQTEPARRARAVIERQARHLARMVDDLLDVTRISHGRIELDRALHDVRDLVRKAVEDHRLGFEARGVALSVELPAAPVWIDADATRVAQVLGNLLQNSAKFSAAGGATAVQVRAAGGQAELRVRDDGAGMTPDLLARLFQPFVQGVQSLARLQGGLGLGLALVKGLVEQHGGSVKASSAGPGRGTEVVVALPLARAPDAAAADADAPVAARRILVIEDSVDAGESLAELLRLAGHDVAVARTGREGIALARAQRPDVVLCDLGLPDVSGLEVAAALRADETLAPMRLIALTGYALPDDRRRAEQAGFDGHLAKPPALDALNRLLEPG